MLPNTSAYLKPDTVMTDRAFALLLKRHFGVKISSDLSPLTIEDYENYMTDIRISYVYSFLQAINQNTLTTVLQPALPMPRIAEAEKYHILDDVYSIIRQNHLNTATITDKDLLYGAAEGMTDAAGDPYTKFFRPDASTDFHQSLEGKIAGIGVVIDIDATGSILVTDVIDHSPAEKAGILPNDKIVKVAGVIVTTQDGIEDDIARLRGKEGTTVDITILSGKKAKQITITRAVISIPLIETKILDKAYYLKYREVAFGSDHLIGDTLRAFLKTGKKRLILDLRDNPGGSMLETRNILNFFIDKGNPLVVLKYPQTEITHKASQEKMTDWSQYEIVIIINQDTASAAEVITTTLREYFPKTVAVVGETSYGKGTVQELVPFDDGSLLKYTIAAWVTPKDQKSIDKIGITPDKTVVFDKTIWLNKHIDTQFLAAEKYLFQI